MPSKIFTAEEVPVPGFLFEDPEDCVKNLPCITVAFGGQMTAWIKYLALKDSGEWNNTMINSFSLIMECLSRLQDPTLPS